MELTFQEIPALPKLAWLAVVQPSSGLTEITHGSAVETRDQFFVEGVWDAGFSEGDFATTDCFFGSGGIAATDAVLFVSSASTTDYLYFRHEASRVVVANSLPLLLAHLDDRLDPAFVGYDRINHSIINGVEGYARDIPTRQGSVRRLMFRNLRVSERGVDEYDKAMPPPFPSYEAYLEYVVSRYGRIAANARDPKRSQPLAILTTASRGYDTTAVNAIAARFGVDKAFTIAQGKAAGAFTDRERGPQPSDDGTEICAVLGIPCVPIDRRSYERTFDDEALYYAALDANQDMNLKEITEHVSGVAILLTGTLGELWYTRKSYSAFNADDPLDDPLKRGDLGGHGLTEVRLAAGLIHVPFPYIGARRRREIFATTESAAMDPWRLRNSYDRPIPRRMAEEAGVPREMFGQTKMATVVMFAPPQIPYSPGLRAEYFTFLTENSLLRSWQLPLFPLVHRFNSMLWFAGERRHAWIYYLQRIVSKVIGRDYRLPLRWNQLNGRLFCFAANRLAAEYARVLAGPVPSVAVPGGAGRIPR